MKNNLRQALMGLVIQGPDSRNGMNLRLVWKRFSAFAVHLCRLVVLGSVCFMTSMMLRMILADTTWKSPEQWVFWTVLAAFAILAWRMTGEAKVKLEQSSPVAPASGSPIHDYFGLTYAAYLVVPRSILQSCTAETQQKVVDAMEAVAREGGDVCDNWPGKKTIQVQLKDDVTGRFVVDPLKDYQRGRRRLWL